MTDEAAGGADAPQRLTIDLDPVAGYLQRERDFQRNEALLGHAGQRELRDALAQQAAEIERLRAVIAERPATTEEA